MYNAVAICPCSIIVNLWFVWDPIQPSVQFYFELLYLHSCDIFYISCYGIEESYLLRRTIIYYCELFVFLLHLILVSFIAIYLALSHISNSFFFSFFLNLLPCDDYHVSLSSSLHAVIGLDTSASDNSSFSP